MMETPKLDYILTNDVLDLHHASLLLKYLKKNSPIPWINDLDSIVNQIMNGLTVLNGLETTECVTQAANVLEPLWVLVVRNDIGSERAKQLMPPLLELGTKPQSDVEMLKWIFPIIGVLLKDKSVLDVCGNSVVWEAVERLGDTLMNVGDYETQALIVEVMTQIAKPSVRSMLAVCWFPKDSERFLKFDEECFELECRKLLNSVNQKSKRPKVYSFVAEKIIYGGVQVKNPYRSDLWVDFNYNSKSISFYCASLASNTGRNEGALWEAISISESSVDHSLMKVEPNSDLQELVVHLNCSCISLISASKKRSSYKLIDGNTISFFFGALLEIQAHVKGVYGRVPQNSETHSTKSACHAEFGNCSSEQVKKNDSEVCSKNFVSRSKLSQSSKSIASRDDDHLSSRGSVSSRKISRSATSISIGGGDHLSSRGSVSSRKISRSATSISIGGGDHLSSRGSVSSRKISRSATSIGIGDDNLSARDSGSNPKISEKISQPATSIDIGGYANLSPGGSNSSKKISQTASSIPVRNSAGVNDESSVACSRELLVSGKNDDTVNAQVSSPCAEVLQIPTSLHIGKHMEKDVARGSDGACEHSKVFLTSEVKGVFEENSQCLLADQKASRTSSLAFGNADKHMKKKVARRSDGALEHSKVFHSAEKKEIFEGNSQCSLSDMKASCTPNVAFGNNNKHVEEDLHEENSQGSSRSRKASHTCTSLAFGDFIKCARVPRSRKSDGLQKSKEIIPHFKTKIIPSTNTQQSLLGQKASCTPSMPTGNIIEYYNEMIQRLKISEGVQTYGKVSSCSMQDILKGNSHSSLSDRKVSCSPTIITVGKKADKEHKILDEVKMIEISSQLPFKQHTTDISSDASGQNLCSVTNAHTSECEDQQNNSKVHGPQIQTPSASVSMNEEIYKTNSIPAAVNEISPKHETGILPQGNNSANEIKFRTVKVLKPDDLIHSPAQQFKCPEQIEQVLESLSVNSRSSTPENRESEDNVEGVCADQVLQMSDLSANCETSTTERNGNKGSQVAIEQEVQELENLELPPHTPAILLTPERSENENCEVVHAQIGQVSETALLTTISKTAVPEKNESKNTDVITEKENTCHGTFTKHYKSTEKPAQKTWSASLQLQKDTVLTCPATNDSFRKENVQLVEEIKTEISIKRKKRLCNPHAKSFHDSFVQFSSSSLYEKVPESPQSLMRSLLAHQDKAVGEAFKAFQKRKPQVKTARPRGKREMASHNQVPQTESNRYLDRYDEEPFLEDDEDVTKGKEINNVILNQEGKGKKKIIAATPEDNLHEGNSKGTPDSKPGAEDSGFATGTSVEKSSTTSPQASEYVKLQKRKKRKPPAKVSDENKTSAKKNAIEKGFRKAAVISRNKTQRIMWHADKSSSASISQPDWNSSDEFKPHRKKRNISNVLPKRRNKKATVYSFTSSESTESEFSSSRQSYISLFRSPAKSRKQWKKMEKLKKRTSMKYKENEKKGGMSKSYRRIVSLSNEAEQSVKKGRTSTKKELSEFDYLIQESSNLSDVEKFSLVIEKTSSKNRRNTTLYEPFKKSSEIRFLPESHHSESPEILREHDVDTLPQSYSEMCNDVAADEFHAQPITFAELGRQTSNQVKNRSNHKENQLVVEVELEDPVERLKLLKKKYDIEHKPKYQKIKQGYRSEKKVNLIESESVSKIIQNDPLKSDTVHSKLKNKAVCCVESPGIDVISASSLSAPSDVNLISPKLDDQSPLHNDSYLGDDNFSDSDSGRKYHMNRYLEDVANCRSPERGSSAKSLLDFSLSTSHSHSQSKRKRKNREYVIEVPSSGSKHLKYSSPETHEGGSPESKETDQQGPSKIHTGSTISISASTVPAGETDEVIHFKNAIRSILEKYECVADKGNQVTDVSSSKSDQSAEIMDDISSHLSSVEDTTHVNEAFTVNFPEYQNKYLSQETVETPDAKDGLISSSIQNVISKEVPTQIMELSSKLVLSVQKYRTHFCNQLAEIRKNLSEMLAGDEYIFKKYKNSDKNWDDLLAEIKLLTGNLSNHLNDLHQTLDSFLEAEEVLDKSIKSMQKEVAVKYSKSVQQVLTKTQKEMETQILNEVKQHLSKFKLNIY